MPAVTSICGGAVNVGGATAHVAAAAKASITNAVASAQTHEKRGDMTDDVGSSRSSESEEKNGRNFQNYGIILSEGHRASHKTVPEHETLMNGSVAINTPHTKRRITECIW